MATVWERTLNVASFESLPRHSGPWACPALLFAPALHGLCVTPVSPVLHKEMNANIEGISSLFDAAASTLNVPGRQSESVNSRL